MKVIKKFLMELDLFTAPATLRIKQQPQMKTFSIGLISLAIASFFIYIFIDSAISLVQYKDITYSETQNAVKSNQINGNMKMFGVSLEFLQFENFERMFQFFVIAHVGTAQSYIPLRPCQPEDWKQLGAKYQQDFYNYYLDYLYCPDVTQGFLLNDTFRVDYPTYIQLNLRGCQDPDPLVCNTTMTLQYLQNQSNTFGYAQVYIYILDKTIQSSQKQAVKYFINIDTRVQLTSTFGGVAIVQFSTYKVVTDSSLWPWTNEEEQIGITVDNVRNLNKNWVDVVLDDLGVVYFTMNQKNYYTKREVGKIQELFSYVGGLFSTIMAFIAFFLANYNQYKYQLKVAESSFTQNTGQQVKQQNFHFLSYIKYSLFDWIKLLCCQHVPDWTFCKQIDQTRQLITGQMEIDKLLRRIWNIECVLESMNEDQVICASMLGLPSVDRVKRKQMILMYHGQVTNGRCPLTLEDIYSKNNNDTTAMNATEILGGSKIYTEYDLYGTSEANRSKQNKINFNKTNQPQHINFQPPANIFPQIQKLITQNPQLSSQSTQIQAHLSQQLKQAESLIAHAFGRLPMPIKKKIQYKIPILILYRIGRVLGQKGGRGGVEKVVG